MTVTVTEEELQRIVSTAVKVALNEIKGSVPTPVSAEHENVSVSNFSDEELDEAMRLMESNRGER